MSRLIRVVFGAPVALPRAVEPLLRVGVIVESLTPPAWIARAIENIAASPHAVLAQIIRCGRTAAMREPHGLLTRIYTRVDANRFRTRDDALEPRELSVVMPHADGQELDVIVTFCDCAPVTRARFGVWTHELPDGLHELATQQTHTIAALRNVDDGTVIASARVATDAISLHRAMNRLRWKCATLATTALRDLRTSGTTGSHPVDDSHRRAESPSFQMGSLAKIATRFLVQKIRDVATNEQWFVAFRFGGDIDDLRSFHRIEPPRDRLWADPFVIQDGDRAWIFVEEMLFADHRGALAVIEARRDGTWLPPVRILERPYHLSYPCVFRWNGDFYMVPETGGDRTVQLFRATDFPLRWEQVSVLVRDIEAVDATPFEHEGRWWMYLTTPSTPNVYDELSLYVADTPLGPWTPHRRNPILSDIVGGRCAGRPFRRNGALIRAAQDGAKRYGHAMQLREIITLSDDAWEERAIGRILPDWAAGIGGTHTLNVDGEVMVVDGFRDRLAVRS
ncbi:MAG TPA: hypothetical protein VEK79_18180 [Thermoanaerobaculia bacterium]|nr:hypothetical protein [Thermoanaerobaculia bacterium]